MSRSGGGMRGAEASGVGEKGNAEKRNRVGAAAKAGPPVSG